MAAEGDTRKEDVVEIELTAPTGWTKKIIPKRGSTPTRGDVVFISPTGKEIKTKKQLELYLKSHPGEPAASEFSWATVDTPRRSARLSEKSKAVEAPATESPVKKQKRSNSSKRGANEKSNADTGNEVAADEEGDIIDKTKESINVPTTDTNDVTEGEAATGQSLPEKPDDENAEKDSTEPPKDTVTDNANSDVKELNNVTTHSAAADTKVEESNKAPQHQVVAGIEIIEPKETSAATDAKIEECDKALEVLAGTKNVEPKETTPTPEAASAQNDECKNAIHTEKGTPIETVTPYQSNAAAASNQSISKDEQPTENAKDNNDPAL